MSGYSPLPFAAMTPPSDWPPHDPPLPPDGEHSLPESSSTTDPTQIGPTPGPESIQDALPAYSEAHAPPQRTSARRSPPSNSEYGGGYYACAYSPPSSGSRDDPVRSDNELGNHAPSLQLGTPPPGLATEQSQQPAQGAITTQRVVPLPVADTT